MITTTCTILCGAIVFLTTGVCHAQSKTNHANTPKSTVKTAGSTTKKTSTTTTKATALVTKAKTTSTAPAKKTAVPSKKPKPAGVTAVKKPAASTVKPKAVTAAPPPSPEDDLYTKAIGLRAGETSGITYKQFFTPVEAFEGILGLWPNAIGITGLYEKYVPFGSVSGLNWYFGGGAHLSIGTGKLFYFEREGSRYYSYRSKYPGLAVGVDGLVGIEYKLPKAPFAISFDIKPFLEVNNGGVLYTSFDPGLGIKVAF